MSTRNTSLVVEKLRHFRSLQRKMADRDRKLTPCARYNSVSVRLVLPRLFFMHVWMFRSSDCVSFIRRTLDACFSVKCLLLLLKMDINSGRNR